MDEAGVKLSLSDVDSYIAYLTGQGKPINTIRTYRRCIRSLAQYLGGTGAIGKGSLYGWRDALDYRALNNEPARPLLALAVLKILNLLLDTLIAVLGLA